MLVGPFMHSRPQGKSKASALNGRPVDMHLLLFGRRGKVSLNTKVHLHLNFIDTSLYASAKCHWYAHMTATLVCGFFAHLLYLWGPVSWIFVLVSVSLSFLSWHCTAYFFSQPSSFFVVLIFYLTLVHLCVLNSSFFYVFGLYMMPNHPMVNDLILIELLDESWSKWSKPL